MEGGGEATIKRGESSSGVGEQRNVNFTGWEGVGLGGMSSGVGWRVGGHKVAVACH